jgi:hypothetical protein
LTAHQQALLFCKSERKINHSTKANIAEYLTKKNTNKQQLKPPRKQRAANETTQTTHRGAKYHKKHQLGASCLISDTD